MPFTVRVLPAATVSRGVFDPGVRLAAIVDTAFPRVIVPAVTVLPLAATALIVAQV